MPATFLAIGASVLTLVGGDRVHLSRPDVRVGDVARLDPLPSVVRSVIADRIVATLPAGGGRTFRRTALVRLVRRTMPGLAVAAGGAGAITIRHTREQKPAGTPCWMLGRAVEPGTELRLDMLAPADCALGTTSALRLDPGTGMVRAGQALDVGTPLGRLALPVPMAVRTGDRLLLTSTSGPVRVRRRVTAFQLARAGGRVFVKAEQGAAFAVPLSVAP